MTAPRAALAALAGALLVAGSPARGQPARGTVPMGASVTPATAQLGQRVLYRGWAIVPPGTPWQFEPPRTGGAFTWGTPRAGREDLPEGGVRRADGATPESVWIEVPLQVFATGVVAIPGAGVRTPWRDASGRPVASRLPTVRLPVVPMVAANDTAADLRPLRGPIPAPWWERVPWRLVAAGGVALAALVALLVWRRRRRRRPVVAPARAPVPLRDPLTEALAELKALRLERLPERGQFEEQAFRLGRLLHRFLERVEGSPRPGDTTPELVGRLAHGRLEPPEVQRIEGLLTRWDRVKFARAATSVEEAVRAEYAVKEMVRRIAAPPAERAA